MKERGEGCAKPSSKGAETKWEGLNFSCEGHECQVGGAESHLGSVETRRAGPGSSCPSPASTRWSMVGKRLQTAVLTDRRMSSEVRLV